MHQGIKNQFQGHQKIIEHKKLTSEKRTKKNSRGMKKTLPVHAKQIINRQ